MLLVEVGLEGIKEATGTLSALRNTYQNTYKTCSTLTKDGSRRRASNVFVSECQWRNSGFRRPGVEAMKCALPPPKKSHDVGITPTVRFSVKGSLWLTELSFFAK